MSVNANLVTAAKPKVGGAVWRAPLGTALPASATAVLGDAFVSLGYISDAGLTNDGSISVEKTRAWGGDVVLVTQTEKTDDFSFALIEACNEEVLKVVYGDSNVSGTLATGITVDADGAQSDAAVYVVDTILKSGALRRIIIPCGQLSAVEPVVYADNAAVAYGVTISALPSASLSGKTHREYTYGSSASGTVTLNASTATVAHGSTTNLTATTAPTGGTVKFFSSDTDVATVSGGAVKGIAAGTAVITARVLETGAEARCTVTVT